MPLHKKQNMKPIKQTNNARAQNYFDFSDPDIQT